MDIRPISLKRMISPLSVLGRILLPVLLAVVYALAPIRVKASTPILENMPATNIYADFAILHCDCTDIGGCSWHDIYFVYYKDGGQLQMTSSQHFTDPGEASFWAVSLAPQTEYHYYPVVITVGGTDEFPDATLNFTTPAVEDPVLVPAGPTDITPTSATLNFDVISMGTCFNAEVHFVYGSGPDAIKSAAKVITAPGVVSIPVSALAPGTTYSYYAVMSYVMGDKSFDTLSFTTPGLALAVTPTVTPGVVTTTPAVVAEPVTGKKNGGVDSWVLVLIGIGLFSVSFLISRLLVRAKKTQVI